MLINSINHFKNANNFSYNAKKCTDFRAFENRDINLNYSPNVINNIAFRANYTVSVLSKQERARGCLFGGAIGDALGRLAEFRTLNEIKMKFGENGIHYIPKVDGMYLITDDTQMTLFTADGLLKSYLKCADIEKEPNYTDIYNSYLNWYKTQTVKYDDMRSKRGLLANEGLYSRRGPGNTCLQSLKTGKPGNLENVINSSAGNGGIMRVAPIALMYNDNPELAFKVAVNCTALTHGSPEAYLPAGFFCSLITNILNNKTLECSIEDSIEILKKYKGHEKTLSTIRKAMSLAISDLTPENAISQIGSGKVGDEALGIAMYCVLKNPNNYRKAIISAVNHDGDSDTTAAIAGNIAGALYGINSIPKPWKENIEFSKLLSFYSDHLIIDSKHNEALRQALISNNIQELRSMDEFSSISDI